METVFITGANRGIGIGLVRQSLGRGWRVFAGARDLSAAADLRRLANQSPDQISLLAIDVTDSASVTQAAQSIADETAAIDILINNAGVYPEGGDEVLAEVSLDQFRTAMDVNYLGTIRVTQALLPLIRASSRGRILNMSSGAATITTKSDARRYCYGPSKTALNMFTRTLAHELARDGIVAAALSPGWVRTEMGGSDADLSVEESATAIVDTLENLKPEQAGLFLDRFGNPDAYEW